MCEFVASTPHFPSVYCRKFSMVRTILFLTTLMGLNLILKL